MKKIIIILLFIPCLLKSQIPIDKQWHIAAGASISGATFLTVNELTNDYKISFRSSVMIMTCASFGKEIYDGISQKGVFSWEDCGYTFISGLATSLIFRFAYKRINNKKNKKELIY